MPKKERDAETNAMQTIAVVLAPLTDVERKRVARWVYDRYVCAGSRPSESEQEE